MSTGQRICPRLRKTTCGRCSNTQRFVSAASGTVPTTRERSEK
ncbi:MAG: hypothetical protein D6761_10100 [Candidatus Dadabacteria bacterium]|nr:MAG: hypothetical protein D6761_10100 [Candidatus Dadabacteria bacterium]